MRWSMQQGAPRRAALAVLCASVVWGGCREGSLQMNGMDGDDRAEDLGGLPGGDQGPATLPDGGMPPVLVDDMGNIIPQEDMGDMPPVRVLTACSEDAFWPVDTPIRQLTPEEIFRTAEQAFFPERDPRLDPKVIDGTRSLNDWLFPDRNNTTGLVAPFPAVEWSSDSFTNGAQAPNSPSIDGYERFATWFFSSGRSDNADKDRTPLGDRFMYGDAEAGITGWSPCQPSQKEATREELDACGAQIIDEVIPKLMRQPFESTEARQRYLDFFAQSLDLYFGQTYVDGRGVTRTTEPGTAFKNALKFYFLAIFQTPQFLYRPEAGTDAQLGDGQAVALTDFELASRLSYFFWQAPPDQELWDLAEAGTLHEEATLEAQARRLLADPRSREVMNGFFKGWLKLEKLDTIRSQFYHTRIDTVASELAPISYASECNTNETLKIDRVQLTGPLNNSLRESVLKYVDWAFWEVDSFETLMSGDKVFANNLMTRIYQWPTVRESDVEPTKPCDKDAVKAARLAEMTQRYELITLPNDERRGILSQPGMMAMSSHDGQHSPVFRGVHLLNAVLCQEVGFPEGLDLAGHEPESEVCTMRDHLTLTHLDPSCQACHALIDGLGFSFEHYDLIGAYVDENGIKKGKKCAVDSSVDVPEQTAGNAPLDFAGMYQDAVEMAPSLASSQRVKACMAAHWLRYAQGRREMGIAAGTFGGDAGAKQRACQQYQIESLAKKLDANGGSLQELVISLVLSPSFRHKAIDLNAQGGAQ